MLANFIGLPNKRRDIFTSVSLTPKKVFKIERKNEKNEITVPKERQQSNFCVLELLQSPTAVQY